MCVFRSSNAKMMKVKVEIIWLARFVYLNALCTREHNQV